MIELSSCRSGAHALRKFRPLLLAACLPVLCPRAALPQGEAEDSRMRACVTVLSKSLERRLSASDYPLDLQNSGTQGTVLVQMTLDRNGRLRESTLAQSSGAPALDQAALRAVQRVYPRAAAAPAECQLGTEVLVTLPIRFELRER